MKTYMDKKVYYGEYSLKHWIELLLKKIWSYLLINETLFG